MKATSEAVLNAALRNDFPTFLHRCFKTLHPDAPFLGNWHLEAIAYQLEQVRRGHVRRLIINAPPRSLKSLMVSVAWPAYVLGLAPARKIFGISYGADLATKLSSDFRSIVLSEWYRRAFPNMEVTRALDTEIHTSQRGFRKSTSVFGALTGMGGDIFILDDPLKPVDAQSDSRREALNEWFSNTLLSRLDNKATGAIVNVMQRVHQYDLTGYLLENSDGWIHFNLPAIAVKEGVFFTADGFHVRREGEVLHSAREPVEVIEQLRRELGSEVFEAQYQQAPVPPGGAMIKRAWLKYYDHAPERTYQAKVIQSWDCASKEGPQNSFSVCTTWLLLNKHFYLLELTRGRFDYPRLRNAAVALAERFKPDSILIEDASAGTALAQELKQAGQYAVRLVQPERDKRSRLFVQQAKFEAGQVLFPSRANFLPALEAELLTFPQSKTNDQVDSISQALASPISKYGSYDSSLSWVS